MSEFNSIFSPEAIKSILDADRGIISLDENIMALSTKLEKMDKDLLTNLSSFSKLNETTAKYNKTKSDSEKIDQQLINSETKLNQLTDARVKKTIANKTAAQQQTAEIKRQIIQETALDGSYKKINAALNSNIQKYQQLSAAERNNKNIGGQLVKVIKQQDAELKKLDSTIGRSQRNVGNYTGALKQSAMSLIEAFGVVGGIAAFASVLKNTIATIARFDQANATLAATLGKSKDDIKELSNSAIELGRVTQFTATQVSELQNELAKLGFTQKEIKSATAGVLDFAAAVGADLAEAAKVTGSTIRALGLSAAETDRVVSTLAVATTKSALSFEDYQNGLSNVLPVAKSFGFGLEDSIALFGTLKDAGFDASKATTATRNILLNLADANGALAKELGGSVKSFDEFIPALVKLREKGIDLNSTLELTDKRSVAAFSTFLENAERADTLRDSITGVNSELADMVQTKTDNVIGASKRLSSAWEGVILKFKESAGVFKNVLDGMASAINLFANENISALDKIFFWRGAKQQAQQDEFARKLRSASKEDVAFTIKQNEEKLANGSKFEQALLKMAKDRLVELEEAEIASTLRIAEEKETKAKQAEFAKNKAATDAAEKAAKKQKQINEKLEKEKRDAFSKTSRDLINEIDKSLEKERKANEELVWDEIELAEDAAKQKEKIAEESAKIKNEYEKDRIEKEIEAEKEAEERRKEIRDAGFQAAGEAVGSFFEMRNNNLQKEFDVLEMQKEAELSVVGLTEQQKQNIEEKYAKRSAEIKQKQAQNEKRSAIFRTIINTASAVVQALPNLVLSGIAAALGLFQLGVIQSQPIPQFAKGLKGNYEGLGIYGEKGRELKIDPKGRAELVSKPTLGWIEKGTTIKTNRETEAIISSAANGNSFVFDTESLRDEIRGVKRAIIKKPVYLVDSDGKVQGIKRGGSSERYLDKMRHGR